MDKIVAAEAEMSSVPTVTATHPIVQINFLYISFLKPFDPLSFYSFFYPCFCSHSFHPYLNPLL